jgi:c-di-GMP-binding flagellar brake protein YcgR
MTIHDSDHIAPASEFHLNSEEAAILLKRVDRSIENINAYLSIHLSDKEGIARRQHERYHRKELVSRITFKRSKFLPMDRVFMAAVQDVSAGGMCIVFPPDLKVSMRDQLEFSVLKSNSLQKIIGGQGRIVRVESLDQHLSIGVQFTEVLQS